MGRCIRIEISDPPTPQIIHRFRNFGEDVYRALRERCTVDIDEIDRATSSFGVKRIKSRDLGRVTKIIERELKAHNFFESATLTRE